MPILSLIFGIVFIVLLYKVLDSIYIYHTKDKIIDKFNNDLKIAEKEIESCEKELIHEIDNATKKYQLENKKEINQKNKQDYLNNPNNWIKHIEYIPEITLESGQRLGGDREFYIKKDSETYKLYQSGLSVDLYWSNDVISNYDISSNK